MNNETFGAKLTLLTSEFKNKLKEVSNQLKQFGEKAEEETTIMPKIIDSGYTRRIEYVKRQMEDIYDSLKIANQREKEGKPAGYDVEKLRADYETLSYRLEDLIEKQKEFNGELEDTDDEANKTTSVLGNLFDKSIGKIKRFTYYLLGARSVFSLFMKYRNIYYQFNEQMQYQSELSQNAIALSLAPAFEFLGNMIAYASIAFAKFIELLTGVNVLSKVTTKGIRDYNKSLKETQTLVSGIDEITNLTMPSGTGLASQYKALNDFQKKIAEVNEWFDKNKWLLYLLAGAGIMGIVLKIGTSLVGGAEAIGKLGTAFGLSGTAGTGILGLAGALKFLAGLGVVSIIVALAIPGIKNDLKEINEKGFKQFFIDTLDRTVKEEIPKIFKTAYDLTISSWLNPFIEKMKEDLKPIWEPMVNEFSSAINLIKEKWDEFLKPQIFDPIVNKFNETKQEILSKFSPFLNGLIEVYNSSMGIVFGKIDYISVKADETKTDIEENLNDISNSMDNTFKDRDVNIDYDITANTQKAENSLTSLFKKFNIGEILGAGTKAVSSWFNNLFTPHAKGLDYVPYDEYPALLHKGEAVVPAKYNPTIHSQGSEYTNSLLETVVMKLDDLASKPNIFEVDGQQFASATYNLYRNEENRQNYNAKVRVNNG